MGCYKLHNYTILSIAHTSNTARSREGKNDAGLYKYKYNGKEYQDELGLNFYDYGFRNYDPALGRFLNLDPASENYKSWSPYVYGADNPLRFIDIAGLGPGDRIKKAESFIGTKYSQLPSLNCGTELRTGNSAAAFEYIDCSELVCRTLAADGVTDNVRQMSTRELVNFLSDEDKFIRSKDEPQPGDVFLWRSNGSGHTGIVERIDEDGTIHTIEAYGTNEGTIRHQRKLSDFEKKGSAWKGFFRPINETKDGKFDKKNDQTESKEKKKSTIKVTFDDGKKKTTTTKTVNPNEINSWDDFLREVNRWMNW